MHLLPRDAHGLDGSAEAVDLGQSPADLVVLSFTDTDLALVARVADQRPETFPSLCLASLARLKHPMSIDLYVEAVIRRAKTVVVRLLGGLDYWRYGAEQLHACACRHGVRLVIIPGDDRADPRLCDVSTVDDAICQVVWQHFAAGGSANIGTALLIAEGKADRVEPVEQARFGVASRFGDDATAPHVAIVFYRALKASADMAAICALEGALAKRGCRVTSLHVAGTKEPGCVDFLKAEFTRLQPDVIINTTAFSARGEDGASPFDAAGCVVLQAVISNGDRLGWGQSMRGLCATDLAMNVVMPEFDGRLSTRAIAFKETMAADERFQFAGRRAVADPNRVAFVADQALALARLRRKDNAEKKIVVMLNDYPGASGRAGHAVGLDGPASTAVLLAHLGRCGFNVRAPTTSTTGLMHALTEGRKEHWLNLTDYKARFDALDAVLSDAVIAAHDQPQDDSDFADGGFRFRTLDCGNALICLQPLRGSVTGHRADYHDMTCPPRHGFLAFYWWLRDSFKADALIHLGAHGSLEWLPGKAAALSETCWPEIALGPLPVIYPFIVSDPGEAAQAKRRLSAVTIGHLTPPLRDAGLHGDAVAIERLLEEYASAAQIDPRRARRLASQVLEKADSAGLSSELALDQVDADTALGTLDAWLCDLKEMRIKDGLHIFGQPLDDAARGEMAASFADLGGFAAQAIEELLSASPHAELDALTQALSGSFVRPGAAGAPSRGRIDTLPTGRNLTTIDPRQSPTRMAETIGQAAADQILARYVQDHGAWPRSIVLDAWGSASIRTGGDELAQAFALIGARLLRETTSDRITGFEVLSLAEIGRPRIDVTLRVSGLYRDLFQHQMTLFDAAVQAVSALNEPFEDNPMAASLNGLDEAARAIASLRVFGPAPQAYGSGLEALVLSDRTLDRAELGEAHLDAGAYAYGRLHQGEDQRAAYRARVRNADVHLRAHDLADQDILDAPDYAYATGGFLAAASAAGGSPAAYHLDTTDPRRFKIRTLGEEIARIVRGRMVNPRWIEGQMRHGWRGAAELAQSVDSLYAFAATTGLVHEHQFDMVYTAYLGDETVDRFLRDANPGAHQAIEKRLADAIVRGYWQPRSNSVAMRLAPSFPIAEAAE